MNPIVRNVLAVIVGFIVGSLVNMVLVMVGPQVVPPPAGVNMSDMQSIKASAHLFEAKHFVFPFLAHALGTLAGALTAFIIAANCRVAFAYVIATLFLAGGIAAAFMIPAPIWFIALDLLAAYLPMAWLATKIGQRIKGAPDAPTSA